MESDRVTAADIASLPEKVKKHVNLTGPKRLRSEGEWVEQIEAGDVPRKNARYYVLTVWEDNVEHLESTGCDRILQEIQDADERMHRAIPSLSTLARLYGKRSGKRLYALRDLEWKWIDCYLKAHPEIDSAARFDDAGSVILWRSL